MQGDGNLVLYKGGSALWSSNTAGHPGAHAVMQGDGNLAVYKGGTARWSSRTAGFDGGSLRLQDDGNAVVYQRGRPVWSRSSGYLGNRLNRGWRLNPGADLRSSDRQYRLVMQGDGNLVLYKGGSALWSSNTAGHPGAHAVMQGDGNLVVYKGGTARWSSKTGGNPGAIVILQNDGNLVVYKGSTALWSRFGTSGPIAKILGPLSSGSVSSSAASHHIVYGGDWSMDVAGGGDVNARFSGNAVSLYVEHVGAACSAPANGGLKVRVRVSVAGATLGTVTYSHIANVAVAQGQAYANGVKLGVAATGLPKNGNCWTGAHVHLEPRNDARYACYLPLGVGAAVGSGTTVGKIGAVGASRRGQPCA
jgi:hypothetical protein